MELKHWIYYWVMLFCVGAMLSGGQWHYERGCEVEEFMLFHFAHANWWHLAANAVVLGQFMPRVSTWVVAYAVACLAAVVDAWLWGGATCGMSALVCACVARKYVAWWKYEEWRERCVLFVLALLMMVMVKGVNWHVHLVAFGMGMGVWKGYYSLSDALKGTGLRDIKARRIWNRR